MIGIDTNILLRYLLKDDAKQSAAAASLIEEICSPKQPAYVCDIVVAEIAWFLGRRLKKPRSEIVAVLHDVTDHSHLRLTNRPALLAAISAYEFGRGDFNDYFVAALNSEYGVSRTLTFDTDAARDGSLELLPVDD